MSLSKSAANVLCTAIAVVFTQTGSALEFTFPMLSQPNTTQATAIQSSTQTHDAVEFERTQWGLADTEWQRYLLLRQGIRGSISPKSLSPIEVLGIHAETASERKKYAKLWARMMKEDTERILAFQHAYSEASKELLGSLQLIDPKVLASISTANTATPVSNSPLAMPSNTAILEGDRVLVFLTVKACLKCTLVLQNLMAQTTTQKAQIDLFFTDTREHQDDALIIAWAKVNTLDQQRLQQKTLTLNHDKGVYFQITQQWVPDVPVVYVMRGKQLFRMTV